MKFLTDEKQEFTDAFLDSVAKAGFDLDIHVFTTTKELVDRIHQRGMKVNVWTCDWLDKAEKLHRFFGRNGIEIVPAGQLEPSDLEDLILLSYNLTN